MHYLSDKRLSWKAKGIFTYLLAQPQPVLLGDLTHKSTDGIISTRKGMAELKYLGYVKTQYKSKNPDGSKGFSGTPANILKEYIDD